MTDLPVGAAASVVRGARRPVVLAVSVVLLLAVAVASVCVGAQALAPAEVWRALTGAAGGEAALIVRDVRVPRTILGVCVGAALGTAGTLVQTLTRNPLAEPGILGVTAGAGFAINLGGVLGLASGQGAQLALASAGAALAAVLVYALGSASPLRLVLTGVALSAVLSGISLGLRLMLPDVFDRFRFWSVGSLAGHEQSPLLLPVVTIAAGLVCAAAVTRPLNTLVLGDEVARALGGHVLRTRLSVLVLVTLLAGAATAAAGPIAFLGLMVPHLARRVAGGSIPWLMAYTVVLGPVLLVASDIGARLLLPTGEVPVAVVTAFAGAPVLIWAVRRRGAVPL
ncbi:iron ABC transporter permease [Nonomuraea sp. KC401]|uniref:FecCD family ABC transporter permease n=1 Tax=unclassified Nonomuraea TaxID=2593643 RepID=UPI0010FD6366|nr:MULTISPECIES: iron chelate uptake ABC transporter family permease subunit [unclassified Nonomuraea]NBE98249.1 iron chelate uptake ABC transporter family permease subunit [Nonomuraea sp. K271]TLF61649.1 iron ABC transporter permease [Nonomuraea sp. KC401]